MQEANVDWDEKGSAIENRMLEEKESKEREREGKESTDWHM